MGYAFFYARTRVEVEKHLPPRFRGKEGDMLDFVKKAIYIGAGLASMTAEKIQEAVDEIVKKGEISEKQGRELVEELFERSSKTRKEMSEWIERIIQDTLDKLKLPTRREIDELRARIDQLERGPMELNARIELLERGGTPLSAGTEPFEAGGEKKV
jgi:polyhydroxyalkanoate synthesis regulator phasin